MEVMKGILVRIKASGKDCIGTSLESLPAKILTLEPAPRLQLAAFAAPRPLQLFNDSVNFIDIS